MRSAQFRATVARRRRLRQDREMLTRSFGYLTLNTAPVPSAAEGLQSNGYVVLDSVFDGDELAALCADVERVFE